MIAVRKVFFVMIFALAWGADAGSIVYRSKPGIPLECSDTLRRFDRFLRELFIKSPYPKGSLTIEIRDKHSVSRAVSREEFSVNCAQLEKMDLKLLSEVGGVMLRTRGKAPENFRLPLFLCGAFRHRERSTAAESRFLGNNRRLASVEALLRNGTLPPLENILDYTPQESSFVEELWFDDGARLLLELLRRQGARNVGAEKLTEAARECIGKKEISGEIPHYIWNNFNPLPPELVRAELDAMLKVEIPPIPENDAPLPEKKAAPPKKKNAVSAPAKVRKQLLPKSSVPKAPEKKASAGEPVPEPESVETIHASALPARLRNHPLRDRICRDFARSLMKRSSRLPAPMRSALRQFHDATVQLGKGESGTKGFTGSLENLEKSFRLYEERSRFLDKESSRALNQALLHRYPLKTNNASGELLTPEGRLFLEHAESSYSGI